MDSVTSQTTGTKAVGNCLYFTLYDTFFYMLQLEKLKMMDYA